VKNNFYIGLATSIFSIAGLINLSMGKSVVFGLSSISSTDFPRYTLYLLLFLGLLLTAKGYKNSEKVFNFTGFNLENYKKPITILIMTLIYIIIIGKIGFFISTAIFLIVSCFYLGGRKNIVKVLLVSSGTLIILYFVFIYWLGLLLPTSNLFSL
jgi:hypothetical protein